MAGFKARFAKSLEDVVAILNLNLRDLEKSSLGGAKTILKGSSDSAPENVLIPNPVAAAANTEHDLLQGLNKGGYQHLLPALHDYVESLQAREDAAGGFTMLDESRLVPVERLPLADILAPHLSAANPHVQYILGSQKGVAGGVCDLNSQGVIPIERIPVGLLGGLTPKGPWDPSTNIPALANPAQAATRGWFYIASGTGTQLGTDWASGDWCISDGATWCKIDNTDRVASVFGRLGAVTAQAGDYAAFYAPLNTTLDNNAGSATPPTTTLGTLVSKIQALRDNIVYILANWLQLGETSATAYRGDRGKTAYDHSQLTASNPHGTTASQIASTATGDVGATNVQAAIAELASEKLAAATAATTYAPIKTTLSDNAASSTLPVTTSGSLVSKIQQIRDYLKYLLAGFGNGLVTKIGTTTVGGASTAPVYINAGVPTACTSLNLSTSGNAGTATKLATARTIALTGGATGSGSFDGSGNLSITATVVDDRHNHVIGNIDGLDAALAIKANKAYFNDDGTGKLIIQSGASSKNIEFRNGSVVFAFSGVDAVPLFYVNTPPLAATENETANAAWVIARAVPTIVADGGTLPAGAPIGKTAFVDGTQVGYGGALVYAPSGEGICRSGATGDSSTIRIGAYRGCWFTKTTSSRWVAVGTL